MRTDSVKKYVIPNIPYLFILWACLKLGTAYRLAPGADFAHKLMGLGQSIGPAFADFAPGLNPFDWLIGIVGAVGFRLLIYMKSKNAKKFRRDEEYGSARCRAPCRGLLRPSDAMGVDTPKPPHPRQKVTPAARLSLSGGANIQH